MVTALLDNPGQLKMRNPVDIFLGGHHFTIIDADLL